jgi:hypothetical protein
MSKVIAIILLLVVFALYTVASITRTAADGFGPDLGFTINFPPGQIDPFLYSPQGFPDSLPLRVRVGGGAGPDSSAARLLEPKIFNSLSSAGQRGALILNGRPVDSARQPARLNPQDAPAPPLEPSENLRVTRPSDDPRGPGHHTHSEPRIWADGNNIVESFNTDSGDISAFSGFAVSSDGGRTFGACTDATLTGE